MARDYLRVYETLLAGRDAQDESGDRVRALPRRG
jgi:hypothetical protein